MNPEFIEQSKQKLQIEKVRLEGLLRAFAHKDKKSTNENFETNFPNMGDSMDENAQEVERYDINLGEEKALETRLQKVNSAFERIASGIYGKCSVGGEEIEEARLKIAPEAETCVKHSQ